MHLFRVIAPVCFTVICWGQTAQWRFDVAAIHRNQSGEDRSAVYFRDGRFVAENASLKSIIAYAYHVKDFQISGGPSWIDSEKFDIAAEEEDVAASEKEKLPWYQYTEQLELAVQALLADRFSLKVTHRPKESTILALVPGNGGPKLRRSSQDGHDAEFRGRRGQLITKGLSLAQLADFLSWMEEVDGRKVLDQTGIDGNFDLTLRWQFERRPPGGPPEIVQPDAPSIFEAVQEQLGLKLEPRKGPVDYLVIDHVERPSEN